MPNRRYTSGVQNGLLQRLALVLAVCIAVYWLLLGSSSFAMSEALRALPAWEMADRGEWLIPYLFDQPYLRKPPGVQWLIMASSEVFGRTEFAARVPSALCMTLGALASTWFAARWFGIRFSHYAGVLHALTPLYWYPGRAAEIESPHNFFVQMLMLSSIDLLVRGSRSVGMACMLSVAIFGAAMTKGPAGAPCLIAVLLAAGVIHRFRPTMFDVRWIVATAIAMVAIVLLFAKISEKAATVDPIVQSPTEFLWSSSRVFDILTLGAVTIGAALPASLGLLAATLRPVEANKSLVRAVGWTVVFALAIYTIVGVYNNRYAMPATTIASVCGPALMEILIARSDRRAKISIRAIHAALLTLMIGSFVHTGWSEARRERISGKKAGDAIAPFLLDGEQVWANQAVEYRAEVIHYAVVGASKLGRTVHPKWITSKSQASDISTPSGRAVIVLMDEGGVRLGMLFEAEAIEWPTIVRENVHKYDVELRRAP